MNCPRCQRRLDPNEVVCSNCDFNMVLQDRFKLLETIGEGAMGIVYKARDQVLQGDVAVKFLKEEYATPKAQRRFLGEAQAARSLSHRSIVVIYDVAPLGVSPPYIVMELLKGVPLSDILKETNKLELRRAIALMREVCNGVSSAHQKGVIHSDLKPANIIVLSSDGTETVKIVDFGLAKLRESAEVASLGISRSLPGSLIGTPDYMSPEACRAGKLSVQSDIYSLGTMIYQMLAGRVPFPAMELNEILRKHLTEQPPSFANEHVPLAVELVVMQALEKDPEKRFKDANAFADALQKAVDRSPALQIEPVIPPLNPFKFDVAKVNSLGEITGHRTYHARSFQERIEWERLDMVEIPGGVFMMGSPDTEEGHQQDESLQHEVTVPPFFMSKFEITQAQWRTVVQFGKVNIDLNPNPSGVRGDNRPVERVSWFEAVEFCDRLSKYTKREYRLPTEAEWEYACRAGEDTPFCFGENINWQLVNYNGTYSFRGAPRGRFRSTTTDVGTVGPPNSFGLYDMLGNVWEWCQDIYHRRYDEDAPRDGSAWLSGEELSKVTRGGSWKAPPWDCGSAARHSSPPDTRSDDIGFRIVCSLRHAPNGDHPPKPEPLALIEKIKVISDKLRLPEVITYVDRAGSKIIDPINALRVFPLLVLTCALMTLLTINLRIPPIFRNVWEPVVWGLLLAVLQLLLLKHYLRRPLWWIPVTTGAAILAALTYYFLDLPWEVVWGYISGYQPPYPFLDRWTTVVMVVALRWTIVAVGQWLILRRFVRRAGLWPLMTLVAGVVCGCLVSSISVAALPRDQVFTIYILSFGILLGFAQGIAFLQFKKKTNS